MCESIRILICIKCVRIRNLACARGDRNCYLSFFLLSLPPDSTATPELAPLAVDALAVVVADWFPASLAELLAGVLACGGLPRTRGIRYSLRLEVFVVCVSSALRK